MRSIRFIAMPTIDARAYQAGALDANQQKAETHISDGAGIPCRHCLDYVAAHEPYLIMAYRPFPDPQPYAEIGPIFVHANTCERYPEIAKLPPIVGKVQRILLRGYGTDNRIRYGTGQIVPIGEILDVMDRLFRLEDVAYIHARSASNNCYQCRIERHA